MQTDCGGDGVAGVGGGAREGWADCWVAVAGGGWLADLVVTCGVICNLSGLAN